MAIMALFGLAACGDAAGVQPTPTIGLTEIQVAPTNTSETGGSTVVDTPTTTAVDDPTATTAASDAGATPTEGSSGTQATPSATAVSGSTGGVVEVGAVLREWSLEATPAEVPAGTVRFSVTNEGQFAHNMTVMDSSGNLRATPNSTSNEGPQVIAVDLQPGTYTLYCSLPGHAQRGQQTEFVVK